MLSNILPYRYRPRSRRQVSWKPLLSDQHAFQSKLTIGRRCALFLCLMALQEKMVDSKALSPSRGLLQVLVAMEEQLGRQEEKTRQNLHQWPLSRVLVT